jgi:Na+-transporting NADH:ubiquinone oxidoreductase subunit F
MSTTIITAIVIFLIVILLLVALLLIIKAKLMPSGNVQIAVNGQKNLEAPIGTTALAALQGGGIFLSSACGGGGKCGQCKCIIEEGAGDILPTEVGFFSRKQIKQHYRLACQSKIKENAVITVPEDVFGVKEWECTVVSNHNVATFIKEFVVALPKGEHMDFKPGSYAQIKIPAFDVNYKDYQVEEQFRADWDKFHMWDLRCVNTEPTVRAYSMANYPAEGDIIMLNVRIATPPFKPRPQVGFQEVNPGIGSSYIWSLKPGDKVTMSGPYGDFHILDTQNEMLYIGGGAGMAPLRAQLLHLFKTVKTGRKVSYWYGARSRAEIFYEEDFRAIEREFPNFSFHIALSAPLPTDNWDGPVGFIHQVIYDNYLKNHDAPEDIEYYMCGPGPMSKAAVGMLIDLGVSHDSIHFDDFGA